VPKREFYFQARDFWKELQTRFKELGVFAFSPKNKTLLSV